jgi:hypothetical protein
MIGYHIQVPFDQPQKCSSFSKCFKMNHSSTLDFCARLGNNNMFFALHMKSDFHVPEVGRLSLASLAQSTSEYPTLLV